MIKKRKIYILPLLFLTVLEIYCIGIFKKNSDVMPLSPEFSRNGLISSSTYQVVIALEVASEKEARIQGRELAVEKAGSLIFQEVFIYRRLSMEGRKRIRKIIEEKGKIILIQKTSDKIYSIVFQVSQRGLKKQLERIY
ncbi:MAG: hypothetical protein OEZ34_05635 [Spirochaetia bacterium]|nr:hypothetical protein [Spirochaetia bacterium]